jgi:PAS domain S-box-containing protein
LETLRLENIKLKQAEEKASTVLDALSSMTDASIICTQLNGIITYFSQGSVNMLGYQPQEMIGLETPLKIHDWKEVLTRKIDLEKKLGKTIAPFEVFVKRSEIIGEETNCWTYVKKDGSRVRVVLTVRPLRSKENVITGWIGIAKEIREACSVSSNDANISPS